MKNFDEYYNDVMKINENVKEDILWRYMKNYC